MAQTLEDMDEVVRYVKNHNLGFTIPYTLNGEEQQYIPDFIACIDDRPRGGDDLLNLIIEVTGEKKKDKAAKVATARRSGFRPSTTTAASAAGLSSKSPTRGMRRTLSTDFSRQAEGINRRGPYTSELGRRDGPEKNTEEDVDESTQKSRSAACHTRIDTVESIRHKDKRKNIPTEELRDFVAEDEHAPKTMLYPRDPSLDPQLVWKGKDEQDREDLAVPVVPIYIQEKIHPQAIIDALPAHRRRPATQQLDLFADFNGLPDDFDAADRLLPPRRSTGRTA